jgi:release factor glutamine methyltransferase
LLAHALGIPLSALLRDPARLVATSDFQALVARRAAHEPLALILGRREFWSLDFAVSPATLIPRPDSETLIEAAIATFAGGASPRHVLDLGTGTGCLLLAALSEFPTAFGIGVDCSFAAAGIAASNAAALGLATRAAFLCADWVGALDGSFDLVLCNPPYVPTSQINGLMPEVARYEPRTALDGGADGYFAFRRLIPDLPRVVARNGAALLEVGTGQAVMVMELAREAGFTIDSRRDLSGVVRALVLRPASS